MKTKNAMSLKALINNKSKELNIPSQLVMQNYIMECLLDRISKSEYKDNFILKGGLLISAMLGIENRATMDMDATIKGFALDKETLPKIMEKICAVSVDDDFTFIFERIEDIRKSDDYNGIRVYLYADYEKIHAPFSLDITAGDKITPKEIDYSYKRLFDETDINILSYPLETVLAEKLETILSRNISNTRPRDFYDVYSLRLFLKKPSYQTLQTALKETMQKRGTIKYLNDAKNLAKTINDDKIMKEQWEKYTKQRPYSKEISFDDVCKAVTELLEQAGFN